MVTSCAAESGFEFEIGRIILMARVMLYVVDLKGMMRLGFSTKINFLTM
jgi:hypothetical protein